MIQLFDLMYRAPTSFVHPIFDIDHLSTTLFAMEFDQNFIQACQYQYGWDFKSLFPSLYDGSFYANATGASSRGQYLLRGFATFCCGAFTQHSAMRTPLNQQFEQSLLRDGYRFDAQTRTLVEVNADTSIARELSELQDRKSLVRDVSVQLQGDDCVAVVFIDLDHFKEVNDQLGHHQGDDCLVAVVRTISAAMRKKGKVYRVGGDEFCVMLPNFSSDEAGATAERIRKSIDALKPFGGAVKVTTSIGVAGSDRPQLSNAEALLKAADDVMYVAKFTTRNRVVVWPPDPKEAAEAKINRKKSLARQSDPKVSDP